MRLLLATVALTLPLFAQKTLFIVHKHADSVGFYDAKTGERVQEIPVGKRPHEVSLSKDGRLAYVTNYGLERYTQKEEGGHTISIIDTRDRKLVGEIDLPGYHRPHGIDRGKSGLFYVTTDIPSRLLAIDGKQRKIVRIYDAGLNLPHMVHVTPDERKAYVANSGNGMLTVVDLKGKAAPKQLNIGGVPMGLTMNHAGTIVYATNRTGNNVFAIDTRTNEILTKIDLPGQPVRALLTPDEKHLLVSLIETGELTVLDAKTLKLVSQFTAGLSSEGLGIDPEGQFGYISAQGLNKVVEFSLKDWKPVRDIKTKERPDPIVVLSGTR